MISDRPYKQAMPHGAALAELRRQSGTQFDPELVNVFISLVASGTGSGAGSGSGSASGSGRKSVGGGLGAGSSAANKVLGGVARRR
jgi:hypothetical protein